MSQKTYMYDTQWQALINAISGGDPTAIVTALGDIKNSIDTIETALGSLSADVTQDSTQWTNLINAISSGGGGGGGTIDIDATQWSNLITEIGKGDMTATATALNNIYTRLNTIGFNSTQWSNLVNAITNQSLTVDLSNVTSSAVSNLSNLSGNTVTDALNSLKSNIASLSFGAATLTFLNIDKIVVCKCDTNQTVALTHNTWTNVGPIPSNIPRFKYLSIPLVGGDIFTIRCYPGANNYQYIYSGAAGNVWLQGSGATVID